MQPSPAITDSPRRGFLLRLALVAVLALLLREQFVLLAHVDFPTSGDSREYVAYALNLVRHGTFSSALPGAAVVADAWRSPGYPWLLAACMQIFDSYSDAWYGLALQLQVLLGAATVALVGWLGRDWLGQAGALLAALLVALWPHHIAATGVLLSEVLLGFCLAAALALAARAQRADSAGVGAAAGLAFAYASLVNPAMLLLPIPVALLLCHRRRFRAAAWMLALALALPGAWSARSFGLPAAEGPGRAALNLVQGSVPQYHLAWAQRHADPGAMTLLQQIEEEATELSAHPGAGLRALAARFASEPGYYLRWYAIEKPYLLWDWDVRLGAGDVYVMSVSNSPLERNPVLRGVKATFKFANPAIFALAMLAAVLQLLAWLRRANSDPAGLLVAITFLYLTAVHVAFQAEPRYSIAYRGFELLLAVSALVELHRRLGHRRLPASQAVAQE